MLHNSLKKCVKMANFRAIPTKMWADDTLLSMSGEQKLIFIYLHTSPYVTQCGIYRLQIKTMGFHLGYTSSPVESALTGFCAAFPDFVAWDKETGEIALLQYPNLFLKDAPQKIWNYVVKELAEVQSMVLLKKIIEKSSATTAKPYLSRLRAINMEIQNQKRNDVNTLLDIDLMQDVENQNVTSEIEIEIEIEKKEKERELAPENLYEEEIRQVIDDDIKREIPTKISDGHQLNDLILTVERYYQSNPDARRMAIETARFSEGVHGFFADELRKFVTEYSSNAVFASSPTKDLHRMMPKWLMKAKEFNRNYSAKNQQQVPAQPYKVPQTKYLIEE